MTYRHIRLMTAAFALVLASAFAFAQEGAPLRWCAYVTHGAVMRLANDTDALNKAPEILKRLRITKVYLEFFRGEPVPNDQLKTVIAFFTKEGFAVAGGIATLPGPNHGVREDGKLGWFNWQAPKTRDDVARLMADASPLFAEIIVDDFFCTDDKSAESLAAKGELSWGEYRRALLVHTAQTSIIVPAKSANPNLTLIMKFPQWYDRFHEFGYDVPVKSAMFDRVWVGTETRGPLTQRYGFVQPYQGFVNYRWIQSIALEKSSGAWFDHGDCGPNDLVDQAYQSVLAGAPEIMLFCYPDLEAGHPGHELLVKEHDSLEALSAEVRRTPVTGVVAYKPPNSDAGPDLFVMDYIGMLGIPLVPQARPPAGARVIFLPTQAAADPGIGALVRQAIAAQATIVVTPGFLSVVPMRTDLAALAGVRGPVKLEPLRATSMRAKGENHSIPSGLDLAAHIVTDGAETLLAADMNGKKVPFFTRHQVDGASIYVLNTRTFSQADYDAVGEVLLPPRPLGIVELPQAAVEVVRDAFTVPLGYRLKAPARITLQPLGTGQYVIQNYTETEQSVRLSARFGAETVVDQFSGRRHTRRGRELDLTIGPRSRVWLRPAE